MKLPFPTFLIILISLFSIHLNGQISKGDFMLDFRSSVNYDNYEPDIASPSLGFSYLKMISNKWMLGGGFNYSNRVTIDYDRTTGERFFYPNSLYRISPQLRYYFSNKRLAPFATVNNDFFTRKYKDTGFKETSWGSQTFAGIGVNYFIAKNIAIESIFRGNVINLGDYKGQPLQLTWNTSLKLFLNSGFSKSVDSLSNKVLKKGNFTTSASLRFNRQFNEFSYSSFTFSPNIKYFINDRLNISAGYFLNKNKYNNSYGSTRGLSLGAEHYQKIIGNFFSSIGFGASISRRTSTFREEKNYFRNLFISSNFNLHYFKKQKRFYGGINFIFFENNLSGHSTIDSTKRWNIFGGLDYYVSDNFYLRTNLNFSNTKVENNPDYLKGTLSFGIGYFFNGHNLRF